MFNFCDTLFQNLKRPIETNPDNDTLSSLHQTNLKTTNYKVMKV